MERRPIVSLVSVPACPAAGLNMPGLLVLTLVLLSLELAEPQLLENVTVETAEINSESRVTLRCPLASPPGEFAVLWYRWEGGRAAQDLRPFYVFNSDQETDWVRGDQETDWVRGDQEDWRGHLINNKVFSLGLQASANVLQGWEKMIYDWS